MDGGCVLKKNCNDYAIKVVGVSAGNTIQDVTISGGKITRDAADTNSKALIHLSYTDDVMIEKVYCDNPDSYGLYAEYSDSLTINDFTTYNFQAAAISLYVCTKFNMNNIIIDGFEVVHLAAIWAGPERMLVVGKVRPMDPDAPNLIERLDEVDREIYQAYPEVQFHFVEPDLDADDESAVR